jgi:hypothetical protein
MAPLARRGAGGVPFSRKSAERPAAPKRSRLISVERLREAKP